LWRSELRSVISGGGLITGFCCECDEQGVGCVCSYYCRSHESIHIEDSFMKQWIFLFTTASRPTLEPIQPPIQWVPRYLSLWVKWPEREVGRSSPSSAEIVNVWSYTSIPPVCLYGVVLSWSTGIT
jgi:hypothetical protein